MNFYSISQEWMSEFLLGLMAYKINFMELPWAAILVTILGLFMATAILVKPISPLGAKTEKEKFPLSQIVIAGLLLSFTGGIVYVLLPRLVMNILWIYLLPLLWGLFSGLFYLLAGKGSSIIRNSAAIFAGNFYVDTDQSEITGIWYMLSRQLWEQPQTLIGNFLGQILNSFGFISHVQHMCGTTLIHGRIPLANGVAFGSFILLTYKDNGQAKEIDISDQQVFPTRLIRHELGHIHQSRNSGPLYLWKYGIPSAVNQAWTEKDAEARSDKWLLHNYGIAPAFKSYPKNYKHKRPGIPGFLFTAAFLIFGIVWGAFAGLVGAYLLISGTFTLLNLGKRPNRLF